VQTTIATTAQGTRCGNHGKDRVYHENSQSVRACYMENGPARPVSAPPATPTSQAPRNLDEARTAAAQRLAAQNSPFFPRPTEYGATPGRVRLINDLVHEILTEDTDRELAEQTVRQLPDMSNDRAKAVIASLLALKKARRETAAAAPQPTAAKGAQGWRGLITQVMGTMAEANFAIEVDGKTRFYRISKRGKRSNRPGTWKIQERVSDGLFPRSDGLMNTVLPAILEMGVEASGKMFFERMHACYKCGASLTDDTGNPYYAMGLGPECGSK